MSYIRWSTPLRAGCGECYVPDQYAEVERAVPGYVGPRYVDDPEGYEGRSLCRRCTSCWYIFEHVDGYIAAFHAGCEKVEDSHERVPFDEVESWRAPALCQFAAEAEAAMREAADDICVEHDYA